ncbi:hypothetical protein FPZ47_10845 [Mycobacterium helveticum]|uniref:Uncharacterized protein n=1 Tax=Mycobacterium helveticum TaxID=2592811 RepID=A0A557XVA0_9MYCO|nr:hypothetical protein FPZ46_22160 [Mycobacterium helveticum]TVS89939.1 hypothetical protein FPZ47_10845 [Mycobacterium helveticum]
MTDGTGGATGGAAPTREGSIVYARSTTIQAQPLSIDIGGFCSTSLLVAHPACRRAVSSSTFDSMDAMARNRDRATELRSRRARDLGAEVVDVAEFELALAHLRVPELV